MFRIYLAVVDLIPAALVLMPLFLLLYVTVYRRNLRKTVLHCLFCLYLCVVFSLVGIPNVTYFRPELNLNLIPFRGFLVDIKNGILNIALFVPLGFLLPLLWKHFRTLLPTVCFGFSLSLSIELMQMLTFRATDVNDLITNVMGTVAGYLLAMPVFRKSCQSGQGRADALLLTILAFCVMFFVHPILSPFLWDRLL